MPHPTRSIPEPGIPLPPHIRRLYDAMVFMVEGVTARRAEAARLEADAARKAGR